ncbi:hypothetical protein [Pelagibacterium montanilacus]|uniref:hypothetical protein n=1 Tax=Pelagibacterium montanilacus TaxID=2185280 RepID=UPI000F8F09C5|nr:hypothetical protein [Pelagibacterium montanilacus]
MRIVKSVALVVMALALAGCVRTATVYEQPQPRPAPTNASLPVDTADSLPSPEPSGESANIQQARLDSSGFRYIDGAALPRLSSGARTAATDAQFYALQFGRPGAPRTWNSGGASGSVSVGPYVRVNNLDCREFTHRVTVEGESFSRSGTACRESDGGWNVADA